MHGWSRQCGEYVGRKANWPPFGRSNGGDDHKQIERIQKFSSQKSSLLLLLSSASLALLVAEDLLFRNLSPLLQGSGALSQAQVTIQPYQLACASRIIIKQFQLPLSKKEYTPNMLTALALQRCIYIHM